MSLFWISFVSEILTTLKRLNLLLHESDCMADPTFILPFDGQRASDSDRQRPAIPFFQHGFQYRVRTAGVVLCPQNGKYQVRRRSVLSAGGQLLDHGGLCQGIARYLAIAAVIRKSS